MARRRHVAVASAIAILLMGGIIASMLVGLTRSDQGREWIRRQVQRGLASVSKGKVHIGALSGSFLTDLTIDSLEFREPGDSLFLATGPLRVSYDPRDIIDGVIYLRSLDVQRPNVRLERRHGAWNYEHIWPGSPGPAKAGRSRGFVSRIALSNVRIRGGIFRMLMPWSPDDSLHGARRDSAVTVAMADPDRAIRRVAPNEFEKEWRWTGINAQLSHAHVEDPDTAGHHFEVARLDVQEHWPPLNLRNTRASVWRIGDTLSLEVPRFDLPGSTGSAKGRVWWGGDLPMRWDLRIHGDSVSMADLHWVWAGLPKTGGGKMDLRIHNERDLNVMDYTVTNMDVRSTQSHIKGSMTFGVGAPVLIMKDVALEAAPLDFRLIEVFNQAPLPLPWRGAITGTVRARGGPVNRWQLDDARVTYNDFNVPGAVTRGSARGGLDILFPAFTKFRGLDVEVAQLDLRTLQALNKEFPRLNGMMSGKATLDSSWLDLRFREGDFHHRDGDSPTSHFTGNGRVTWGEQFMTFDLAMAALPLSTTALARSYAAVPLRGDFSGPLRVKGTSENLAVTTDLVGDAGRLEVDGTFDISEPSFRVTARGSATGLDLRRALDRRDLPSSALNLRWSADVLGDSLPDLRGNAEVQIDRSMLDSVRVYGGAARLRFMAGTLAVDSLRVESAAFTAQARGRLALAAGRAGDSVAFRVVMDSLGGFRRAIRERGLAAAVDTSALDGTLRVDGALAGTWPALRVSAGARGSDVRIGSVFARDVDASVRLAMPIDSLRGTMRARLEGVTASGIRLNTLTLGAELPSAGHAIADVKAELFNGPLAAANADVAWSGDTTALRLDRIRIGTGSNDWALLAPARITKLGNDWAVDSLVLVGRDAGRIAIRGAAPSTGAVDLRGSLTAVPLADVGELLQTKSPLSGTLTLDASAAGTRDAPMIRYDGRIVGGNIAGVNIERAEAAGAYADQRLDANLRTYRGAATALRVEARLPLNLSLHGVDRRVLTDQPLRIAIKSDSAGVAALETLTPEIRNARGALALDATIGGTLDHPRIDGALKVADGSFDLPVIGTTWRDVHADVAFRGDSVVVQTLDAISGTGGRGGRAALSGWVGLGDIKNPAFDLQLKAENFNVIAKPRVADLDLSGGLRVAGTNNGSTLTGALAVNRGTIFIPDIFNKDLISLDDPELMNVVDTAALADHGILPRAPSRIVEKLTVRDVPVTVGSDVTLRSSEANVTLGGAVRITASRVQRGRDRDKYQLALDGTLQTVRGTYRLNAGPVQRTFEVEGGEVRFRGDPDPNLAEIDIHALHTVRTISQTANRQDVRVRVNIGGTLGSPRASFSTPDSARVSDSDILSYLITGGPSDEILGRAGSDARTTAYRLVLSSLGSVIGSKVPQGLCNDAQFSAATLDQYSNGLRDVGSVLSGSRFNCAKQVTERIFVRVDAGLCSVGQLLGQGSGFDSRALAEAFGLKLDFRLNHGFTASGGLDPSTSATLCTRDAATRGFAPTPRQVGLDLIRAWQF